MSAENILVKMNTGLKLMYPKSVVTVIRLVIYNFKSSCSLKSRLNRETKELNGLM